MTETKATIQNEIMCRICLGSSSDPSTKELGHFCSPCKCAGSIKYVHQECIKRWMVTSSNESDMTRCPQCRASYKIQRLPVLKTSGTKYRVLKWILALLLIVTLNVFIAWVLPWYIRCVHGHRMCQTNVFFINTNTLSALFLPPGMLDKINHLDYYTLSPEPKHREVFSIDNGRDFSYVRIGSTLYRYHSQSEWFHFFKRLGKPNERSHYRSLASNFRSLLSRLVLKHVVGDAFATLVYPEHSSNRRSSSSSSSSSSLNLEPEVGRDITSTQQAPTASSQYNQGIMHRFSDIKELVDIDLYDVICALWSLKIYETFTLLAGYVMFPNIDNLVSFYDAQTLYENLEEINVDKFIREFRKSKSVGGDNDGDSNTRSDNISDSMALKEALFGSSAGRSHSSSLNYHPLNKQCVRLGDFDDLCAACIFGLLKTCGVSLMFWIMWVILLQDPPHWFLRIPGTIMEDMGVSSESLLGVIDALTPAICIFLGAWFLSSPISSELFMTVSYEERSNQLLENQPDYYKYLKSVHWTIVLGLGFIAQVSFSNWMIERIAFAVVPKDIRIAHSEILDISTWERGTREKL